MLSNNLKKYFLPLLLIVSVAISFIKPPGDNLENVAGKIQGQLNNAERIFSIQSADSVLPGLTTDNSEVFSTTTNNITNGGVMVSTVTRRCEKQVRWPIPVKAAQAINADNYHFAKAA